MFKERVGTYFLIFSTSKGYDESALIATK